MNDRISRLASFVSLLSATIDPLNYFCFADGDEGGDAGGGGGSTALTASDPLAAAGEGENVRVPSLGEAMYGDDTKPKDETGKEKPADKPKEGEEGKAADWKEYEPDKAKTDEENAAAKAEHDKTKPADKDAKKEDDVPEIKPEDYEYAAIPEGFELDEEVDKEFREIAAKLKLPKEAVKDLTALQIKMYAKQQDALAATVEGWGESLKTDKEVGGRDYPANMAKAREAKIAFFPPEINALLDKTGLGNHPAMVKGLYRIGKAMGETGTLQGKPVQSNGTLLENLYGTE